MSDSSGAAPDAGVPPQAEAAWPPLSGWTYYLFLVTGVVLGGGAFLLLISLTQPVEFVLVAAAICAAVIGLWAMRSRGRVTSAALPLVLVLAGAAAAGAFWMYRGPDAVGIVAAALLLAGAVDLLLRAWEGGLPESEEKSWSDKLKEWALLFSIALSLMVAGRMGSHPKEFVPGELPTTVVYRGVFRTLPPLDSPSRGSAPLPPADSVPLPWRLSWWTVTDTVPALTDADASSGGPCGEIVADEGLSRALPAYLPDSASRGSGVYAFRFVSRERGTTAHCLVRRLGEWNLEVQVTFRSTRGALIGRDGSTTPRLDSGTFAAPPPTTVPGARP